MTIADPAEARASRIRLARPDEFAAIGALLDAAYSHEYELTGPYRASFAAVAERAAESDVWVAVDDETDAVLGTVVTPRPGERLDVAEGDDEIDFRLLAVDPAARGRGIGRALVAHVESLGRERGASSVVLSTGALMARARRLYENLGFERLVERDRAIEIGDRRVEIVAFRRAIGS